MKVLNVSEFRSQLLSLLENLPGSGVVVTKRGKPVAKLVPLPENDGDLIGCLKGVLKIKGDIMTTGDRWDAES